MSFKTTFIQDEKSPHSGLRHAGTAVRYGHTHNEQADGHIGADVGGALLEAHCNDGCAEWHSPKPVDTFHSAV